MTHHTDAERAKFEAVASDDGKWPQAIERDAKGNYLLLTTAHGWMWWQAARRAQVAAVPHGWKLVPEKPTSAMLCALMQWDGETGLTILPEYKAMLAAAPQPPDAAQSNSLEFGGIKTEAAP